MKNTKENLFKEIKMEDGTPLKFHKDNIEDGINLGYQFNYNGKDYGGYVALLDNVEEELERAKNAPYSVSTPFNVKYWERKLITGFDIDEHINVLKQNAEATLENIKSNAK